MWRAAILVLGLFLGGGFLELAAAAGPTTGNKVRSSRSGPKIGTKTQTHHSDHHKQDKKRNLSKKRQLTTKRKMGKGRKLGTKRTMTTKTAHHNDDKNRPRDKKELTSKGGAGKYSDDLSSGKVDHGRMLRDAVEAEAEGAAAPVPAGDGV